MGVTQPRRDGTVQGERRGGEQGGGRGRYIHSSVVYVRMFLERNVGTAILVSTAPR